jgi:hypothetical protein
MERNGSNSSATVEPVSWYENRRGQLTRQRQGGLTLAAGIAIVSTLVGLLAGSTDAGFILASTGFIGAGLIAYLGFRMTQDDGLGYVPPGWNGATLAGGMWLPARANSKILTALTEVGLRLWAPGLDVTVAYEHIREIEVSRRTRPGGAGTQVVTWMKVAHANGETYFEVESHPDAVEMWLSPVRSTLGPDAVRRVAAM